MVGWLYVELETDSVDEDIFAVKKKKMRKENLKIMIILMKKANLSAYKFDQNPSLLETYFSWVTSKKLLMRRTQR